VNSQGKGGYNSEVDLEPVSGQMFSPVKIWRHLGQPDAGQQQGDVHVAFSMTVGKNGQNIGQLMFFFSLCIHLGNEHGVLKNVGDGQHFEDVGGCVVLGFLSPHKQNHDIGHNGYNVDGNYDLVKSIPNAAFAFRILH
jgi:hypothetical protein